MSRARGSLLLLALLVGCDRKTDHTDPGNAGPAQASSPRPLQTAAHLVTASVEDATRSPEPTAPTEPSGADAVPVYAELSSRFKLGDVHDLGPAAPAAATSDGVLFVTRDDRLLRAPRRGATFESLNEPVEMFAKFGRSPAVSKTHVYWVARSELRRAARNGSASEVIVPHARAGTRATVQTASGRDVVGYIAEVNDNPRAFVWAQGHEPLQLSEDASTASSLRLVAGSPYPKALILEGRLGMSPLHVRTIQVTKTELSLGKDEVIWVGPGAQPLTELASLDRAGEPLVLLAASRDVSHFGLAHFPLKGTTSPAPEPEWRLYPNGIDPAPVTSAQLCGADYVLYAVPSETRPRSPQELRIARVLGAGEFGEDDLLARSRAFNDISVASAPGGAVLSWTADNRTWGMWVGCPK